MAGPTGRAAEWPFIGREQELQQVATALGRTDTTGVVLAGPAGVGKTRLADECRHISEAADFVTARAVATRAAATIPLGAFAPLMASSVTRGAHHGDLIQEAVAAIVARGADRPLVLVVDDAHLLDDASAAVLHHLAMTDAAFVIATVRTGDPAPDSVTALWKDFGAERIDVQPFSELDTERLIHAVLGGPADGATVRDLYDASRGNPLYLRELLLGGLDTGLLREEDGLWRFTFALSAFPRLVDLVEARLADLGDDDWEVLELVALGEPLHLGLLESLTALDVIESLERRGLLDVVTGASGPRVGLAHPLHGEVVRERMPKVRGMLLSRRLADVAETAPALGPDDIIRFVLWRLDGGATVAPDDLVSAARRAFFAHDTELAERLARAAIEGGAGGAGHQVLGETLLEQGRHGEAESALATAQSAATTDEERALAGMARAATLLWGLGRDTEAFTSLIEAESQLGPGPWHDEVIGMRATHEMLAGRPAVALDMVDRILATGEGRPLVEATIAAGPALAIMGRCDDAVAVTDRGWAVHLELGDLSHMTHPGIHLIARALALGEAGRLAEANATAQACYDAALTERRADGHAWAAMLLGRVAMMRGRLGVAVHWFREGAAVYRDLGQAGPRRWCLAGIVLASAMLRDVDRSTSALDELDMTTSPMLMMEPEIDRARAWHSLVTGQARMARDQLRRAGERARDAGSLALESGAVHDLARVGTPELAVGRLVELAAVVDGPLTATRAQHAAALVAQDPERLELVSQEFEELEAVLLAAEAAAGAAACYRRGGETRSTQRCTQRAAALGRSCEGARTPALVLGGEVARLSPREREVALLAAAGLSNGAIAEQLFVSVRTVESHLHHAFTKLGVTTREELRAAADLPDGDAGQGGGRLEPDFQ